MNHKVLRALAIVGLALVAVGASKVERFDGDPGWEGRNHHIAPKELKTVRQDFGYSGSTHFAGGDANSKGEIGGTIWRCSTPASYADAIEPKTLNDRLSAAGTFAITATSGSSGAFFGFFKADAPEGGRQNSLGFRFAGAGSGARLTLQLVTATNQACGTKITQWTVDKSKPVGAGRKVRPPSIKNDGTRYTWKLDYDPAANNGDGQIQFTIRSNSDMPEEFEGKAFTVNLPKGYKDHGTTFDRIGLATSMRPGNSMTVWFDDLEYAGKRHDLSRDPGWIGVGNHASYQRDQGGGVHDFGFSDKTSFAGGSAPGELGGIVWRSGEYAYYGDRVGPLSLEDRLEASGTVVLTAGPPDSAMMFGWFNSAEKEYAPQQAGSFLGVKIGGPTRVGHYFVPAYAPAQSARVQPATNRQHPLNVGVERGEGPVLVPQKVFKWKLIYDPAAEDGRGAITATLGDQSATLPLKPGHKSKGATFDRFGIFSMNRGGSYVKVYFDDLTYTSKSDSN